MIHEDKPSLEEALEHHGVKGMKWGVRKVRETVSSPGFRREAKKVAVEVGTGVLVVGGLAVASHVIGKYGGVPMPAVARSFGKGFSGKAFNGAQKTGMHGQQAVKAFDKTVWKHSVASLSKEIADANVAQDQWMRSIGLGAVVNNAR